METKNYCAYNVTRNALLSDRVAMADASLGSMKILDLMMHGREAGQGSAVWLTGCTGSPNVPRLFTFDVLYMDAHFRVVEAACVSPEASFPAAAGEIAGALILPDGMLASTGTAVGDLLRMCDDAELAALVKAGSDSILEQRTATAPVAAAGSAPQVTVPFEVVRAAGFVFEPFMGSLIHLADVRAHGASSADYFLPGAAVPAESAHAFAVLPVTEGLSAEVATEPEPEVVNEELMAQEPVVEEPAANEQVATNGATKWGEPKKKRRKAAKEDELRFYRPQPIKFFDPMAESEVDGEADAEGNKESSQRPSNQLPTELKAAILQIDEQLRQKKKEKEEQKQREEPREEKKSLFRKTKPAKELEQQKLAEGDREPQETAEKTASLWGRFGIRRRPERDRVEAVETPAQLEPPIPVQQLSQPPAAISSMAASAEASSIASQAATPLAEEQPKVLEKAPEALQFVPAAEAESVTTAPAMEEPQVAEPEAELARAEASGAAQIQIDGLIVDGQLSVSIPENEPTIVPVTDVATVAEAEPEAAAATSVTPQGSDLIPAQEPTVAPSPELTKAAKRSRRLQRRRPAWRKKESRSISAQEQTTAAEEGLRIAEPESHVRAAEEPKIAEIEPHIAAAEAENDAEVLISPPRKRKVVDLKLPVEAAVASAASKTLVPTAVPDRGNAAQAAMEGGNSAEVKGTARPAIVAQPAEAVLMQAHVAQEQVETSKADKRQKKKEKIPLKARLQRWFEEETDKVLPDPNERRAERMSLPGLVAFYFSGGTPRPHEIVNISRTGLYLKTTELWSVETMVRMTLQRQAKDEPKKQESISVLTRVVRIDEGGVGHEFVTMEALMAKRGRDIMPDQGTDWRALDKFLHFALVDGEGTIMHADPQNRKLN